MGLVKSFSTQVQSSPLNKGPNFEFGLGLEGQQSLKNVENFSSLPKDSQNSSTEGEKIQVTHSLGSERESVVVPSYTEKSEVPGTPDSTGHAGRGGSMQVLLPTPGVGQDKKCLLVIPPGKNAIQVWNDLASRGASWKKRACRSWAGEEDSSAGATVNGKLVTSLKTGSPKKLRGSGMDLTPTTLKNLSWWLM